LSSTLPDFLLHGISSLGSLRPGSAMQRRRRNARCSRACAPHRLSRGTRIDSPRRCQSYSLLRLRFPPSISVDHNAARLGIKERAIATESVPLRAQVTRTRSPHYVRCVAPEICSAVAEFQLCARNFGNRSYLQGQRTLGGRDRRLLRLGLVQLEVILLELGPAEPAYRSCFSVRLSATRAWNKVGCAANLGDRRDRGNDELVPNIVEVMRWSPA
jgi:hypothetical protein